MVDVDNTLILSIIGRIEQRMTEFETRFELVAETLDDLKIRLNRLETYYATMNDHVDRIEVSLNRLDWILEDQEIARDSGRKIADG